MNERLKTAEELAEWFDYEPRTGALVWARSPCPRMKVGQPAGTLVLTQGCAIPYLRVTLKGVSYMASIIAWTLATGEEPPDGRFVRPIDGNPLNLRASNLKIASAIRGGSGIYASMA